MTSDFMKLRLMEHYRFKRGMIVGVEAHVARGIADILAISIDLQRSYEIEIKTSISDLKADFKNKENKHLKMEEDKYDMAPNYFIFAFPKSLLEKAEQFLKNKNNKYGIISINEDGILETIRSASILNTTDNIKLKHYLDLRINNFLITTLQKNENNYLHFT